MVRIKINALSSISGGGQTYKDREVYSTYEIIKSSGQMTIIADQE